jgi:5'-nucleotidase
MPHEHRSPDGTVVEEGGLALYAGALSVVRAEAEGRLLLLDAGDIFQGTLASDTGEGTAMVNAFNALGMTAVAVGNHEFDYGPVGPAAIPTAPGDDPLGALKARVAQARFPFLAANIVDASTGRVPDWLGSGTTSREVGGVRVGLIGLTTLDSPRTNPVNVAGLRFLPLAPTARAAAERLRAEGAEVIVVIAHAGGRCEEAKDPNDLSRCNRSGEIFEMLEALPPGTVDAVVAGHTHATIGHFVHGTPVIETSAFGRSFGLITLSLDPSTRRPIPDQARIEAEIPLCEQVVEGSSRCDWEALRTGKPLLPAMLHGRPLRRDPALEALIAPALAQVAAKQTRLVGVEVPVALRRSEQGESPLGSTATDAVRRMEGAAVAVLNSAALRADLEAGALTYGRLYETFPSASAVATLRLNSSEVRALLVALLASGRIPQQSGLRMEVAVCPTGLRMTALELEGGGRLVEGRLYPVVLPDNLARGGEGLEAFMASLPDRRKDLGERRPLNLRDSLAADLARRGKPLVAPTPGRTSVLRGEAAHCI